MLLGMLDGMDEGIDEAPDPDGKDIVNGSDEAMLGAIVLLLV